MSRAAVSPATVSIRLWARCRLFKRSPPCQQDAPNRGHNSIASFAVDGSSGRLTALGHMATEAVPSAFSLDPEGHFLFAAGSASDRLAAYRVNGETGALTPLGTYAVGKRPMWVLITRLGG